MSVRYKEQKIPKIYKKFKHPRAKHISVLVRYTSMYSNITNSFVIMR